MLMPESTTRELADRLFERLGPTLGLECYVHVAVDPDAGDGTLRLAATAGLRPEQLGPIGILSTEQAHEPGPELIRDPEVSAYVCHPLLADGEVLGILAFGSRTRAGFTDAEVELLRAAGDVLAAGVARDLADRAERVPVVVGQATGIVMERDGLSPDAALGHLRGLALRHDLALEVLSSHLVAASNGRSQRCA